MYSSLVLFLNETNRISNNQNVEITRKAWNVSFKSLSQIKCYILRKKKGGEIDKCAI